MVLSLEKVTGVGVDHRPDKEADTDSQHDEVKHAHAPSSPQNPAVLSKNNPLTAPQPARPRGAPITDRAVEGKLRAQGVCFREGEQASRI